MTRSQTAPPIAALSGPVGHFMRQTLACDAADSIERALLEFRRNGGHVLPVVENEAYVGAITETTLSAVLEAGVGHLEPCTAAMSEGLTIAPYASAAEALRLFSEMDVPTLVVVDDAKRVVGLISPSDLFPRRRTLPTPAPVGGMATPFGVYLMSGALHGGVGLLAVMATGAVMAGMWVVAIVGTNLALLPLRHYGWSTETVFDASQLLSLPVFLLLLRLSPIAGTHAAEHMSVHAMERGEELAPEIVARMPRVHPRCGTNLMAAITLFMGVWQMPWISDEPIRFLAAVFVTLFFWRPLGSLAQQYVTTKKPNQRQIRSGIKAATDLIEKYSTARYSTGGIPIRIWNSGILHVMAGGALTLSAVKLVAWLCHCPLPGLD